ncbi:MAG: undecaprenyl/decaprenyl-phosphate alpha-N-acetylglucosaminyl 1-phosphate transferase [Actinobacteria bacterium]|nr:MAG: undecaprenyl/decaprenyl-phosphate alpha-N-acetylglucosaminyl 1-phosphate transferase [Actinomycetota bacterium]
MQATVCTGRSEPHRRSREATSRRTSLAALVGGRPAGRPRAPLPHRRRGRARALRARRRRARPRAGAALMFETLADHLEIVWGALAGFAIVVVLTPAVGGVARRLGAVDRPERRRLNRQPVPRLGGLALFFGIFVPALAFLDLTHEARGLLLGAAVATVVGAIDDFRGLEWWQKLAGQVAAAAIPVGFGIWVHRFTFPIVGIHVLPKWIGMPLSVLWIVAIMNMVNFLDGLDGLAAGVSGISAFTFALIALSLARPEVQSALLSAIVLGAALGFLRHNFYPARIFMGDSGALLLGFVLAVIPLEGLLKTASIVTLFFPLLVLAVPIVDTTFVVARRLKHGEKVFEADQAHLHYRFLRRGFSQVRATVYIWTWCALLAAAALGTRFIRPHAHGHWHLWRAVGAAAIGLVALAASVYMVYLLEIVKLASVRARLRQERKPPRAA